MSELRHSPPDLQEIPDSAQAEAIKARILSIHRSGCYTFISPTLLVHGEKRYGALLIPKDECDQMFDELHAAAMSEWNLALYKAGNNPEQCREAPERPTVLPTDAILADPRFATGDTLVETLTKACELSERVEQARSYQQGELRFQTEI